MSINDLGEKSNQVVDFGVAPKGRAEPYAKIHYLVKPFYNLILILVIASIFFALGRLSALEERHVPIKIGYPNTSETATVLAGVSTGVTEAAQPPSETTENSGEARLLPLREGGQVIGSKNGKKYYFPWCGTVKMIKPENQIKFSSIEEARKAGYLPAANCKGLK